MSPQELQDAIPSLWENVYGQPFFAVQIFQYPTYTLSCRFHD